MNDLNYCEVDTNQIDQFNSKFTEILVINPFNINLSSIQPIQLLKYSIRFEIGWINEWFGLL